MMILKVPDQGHELRPDVARVRDQIYAAVEAARGQRAAAPARARPARQGRARPRPVTRYLRRRPRRTEALRAAHDAGHFLDGVRR